MFNRFDSSRHDRRAAAAAGRLPHRHDRQVAPRQRSRRASIAGRSCRDRASTSIRSSTRRRARRPTRAATSPTSSPISRSTSSTKRPRNKPFFLMLHHKAPHRAVGAGPRRTRRSSHGRWIPEPVTFWDAYATRTDALHENQQRVAEDLTRRDLKLAPPPDLAGAELTAWLGDQAGRGDDRRATARPSTLTGEALARWKYQRYMQDYLATVQSVDDSVGRVLDFLDRRRPRRRTRSSSTPATRASSSATTACSTSASCTRSRCACRSSCAGRRRSSPARAATRSALNVDFAPTFLDAAGVPVPADMQGRSLLPVAARPHAAGLADVDVLPLLPRPRRPQHARALRRAHARRTS